MRCSNLNRGNHHMGDETLRLRLPETVQLESKWSGRFTHMHLPPACMRQEAASQGRGSCAYVPSSGQCGGRFEVLKPAKVLPYSHSSSSHCSVSPVESRASWREASGLSTRSHALREVSLQQGRPSIGCCEPKVAHARGGHGQVRQHVCHPLTYTGRLQTLCR